MKNLTKKNDMEVFKNFVFFKTKTWKINIDVFFQDNTLWLTQKKMWELFETTSQNITLHLQNLFQEWEITEEWTCKEFLQVQIEWKREVKRKIQYYNLKAILSVWYRCNSVRAIEFRKWASNILEEFVIKGFTMDDERLKQIQYFWKDYFEELLERIKEIRLSERRLYQKITDIYTLSADYDSQSDITQHFFATVQNKLHWAITWKTAAEIIYTEADATKIYMWLKTWKQAPNWKILKSDVIIAKNYLSEEHIKKLNSIVNSYLDLAENKAQNKQIMNMVHWDIYLQQFLELTNYPILKDNWKISMLEAKLKAESEYDKFRVIQDKEYISDFDEKILLDKLKYNL